MAPAVRASNECTFRAPGYNALTAPASTKPLWQSCAGCGSSLCFAGSPAQSYDAQSTSPNRNLHRRGKACSRFSTCGFFLNTGLRTFVQRDLYTRRSLYARVHVLRATMLHCANAGPHQVMSDNCDTQSQILMMLTFARMHQHALRVTQGQTRTDLSLVQADSAQPHRV